jgi:superfamily II DNA or RNA helicase
VKFTVDVIRTHVRDVDPIEFRYLYDILSYKDPRAKYSDDFRSGEWDGVHRVLHPEERWLYTGWLKPLLRRLDQECVEFEVEDPWDLLSIRDPIESPEPVLSDEITLRPYQISAVQRALRHRRGIIDVATGGGKTEIAYSLLETLFYHKLAETATYVVPTQAAMEQTAKRLAGYGLNVGRVGAGKKELYKKKAQVMVGILASWAAGEHDGRWTWLEESDVLILDECHHTGAPTWTGIAEQSDAQWRFGFSGTPIQSELSEGITRSIGTGMRAPWHDLALIGLTGEPIISIRSHYLRNKGWLATPKIVFIPSRSTSEPLSQDNEYWPVIYERGIVKNKHRNHLIVGAARKLFEAGHKTMIFVRYLEHGRDLLEKMDAADIDQVELHSGGGTVLHPRSGVMEESPTKTMQRLGRMPRWCVICSPVYDEAVDIPTVTAVMMAAGGKSMVQTLQRVGRGLRGGHGDEVLVVDFDDSTHRYLKHHSNKRRELYEQERMQILTNLRDVDGINLSPEELLQ